MKFFTHRKRDQNIYIYIERKNIKLLPWEAQFSLISLAQKEINLKILLYLYKFKIIKTLTKNFLSKTLFATQVNLSWLVYAILIKFNIIKTFLKTLSMKFSLENPVRYTS